MPGFWVGKFETSHTGCTTDKATGETDTNVTTLTPQIKAGVTSWRSIQISNIFTVCTEMNKNGNPYGLNSDDNKVDPHMMKNSEWGAVAYLFQNEKYGETGKITKNDGNTYITGNTLGGTTTFEYKTGNGPGSSTTGNTTGVYGMAGGSGEYVAGYVNNSYVQSGQNPYKYGQSLIDAVNEGKTKYADVYKVTTDDSENNYNNAQPITGQGTPTKDTGHYGDAVWETSGYFASEYKSWYDDFANIPLSAAPFFIRDNYNTREPFFSVFPFNYGSGNSYGGASFRVVVPVL